MLDMILQGETSTGLAVFIVKLNYSLIHCSQIRQKGNLAPQIRRPSEQSRSGSLNSDQRGASQILRIIVSEKRREAKAAHKLGIIVLFFMICWMPLYTINCIQVSFINTLNCEIGKINYARLLKRY
jgi:hypothetical protein